MVIGRPRKGADHYLKEVNNIFFSFSFFILQILMPSCFIFNELKSNCFICKNLDTLLKLQINAHQSITAESF